MTRRYLTHAEAGEALRRGRSVEAFLGGFRHESGPAIRWVWLKREGERIRGEVRESPDPGSIDHLDLYGFGSLDGDDEPAFVYSFASFDEGLRELERQFPGVSARLVNEGVVQDEYRDYLLGGARRG